MISVAIAEKNAWISFRFGGVKVISQIIQGNAPDHASLIPRPTNKINVMAPELCWAVARTKNIALAASGIVRLKWSEEGMDVYATAEEIGEASTTIHVDAMDGPGHVAIDYKYLAEYLKGKDSVLKIGIADKAPVTFEYPGAPLTLMMPMFCEW
jgi:DNA polymerase III sliding clamp (beta) subunit (PCNA family)